MNLKVMRDFSEIISYEIADFPAYISRGKLSNFTGMKALGHCHDDIEIMRPLRGNLSYDVNGRTFFLREGDAIVVNAQQMHYPYSADGSDCEYLCVLFQPKILTGNYFLENKFIEPVIHNPRLTENILSRDKSEHAEILRAIDEFLTVPKIDGNELHFLSLALNFWTRWLEFLKTEPIIDYKTVDSGLEIQKRMLEFIYKNYPEKIKLADIARAGGVCKTLCCKIFKKYLGKTPVDFLNGYRLQVATKLLNDSELNVTEISGLCGFGNPSYFAEIFLKVKGCTPSSYRAQKNF